LEDGEKEKKGIFQIWKARVWMEKEVKISDLEDVVKKEARFCERKRKRLSINRPRIR
jgi:hypothetical protein